MRTKEEAQKELQELFGMPKTSDFQKALRKGEIEKAEAWLKHIQDNKSNFPQYHSTWDNWLSDRKAEIQEKKNNPGVEISPKRSKEEAQKDLIAQFGFGDTKGFRSCLANNEVEKAEKWLETIKSDPGNFPQYLATWKSWLNDRENELKTAKGE